MELGKGFEKTEVGTIPKDWAVNTLADTTDKSRPISYGIVQTGPEVLNGVRCLRVVDITDGRIREEGLITTSNKISNSYKRTILKSGDLIIPLRGKVGDVAIVPQSLEGANLTRGLALIAVNEILFAPFLKHYISFGETRVRLAQAMSGSALQEISISALRYFKISFPSSRAEQEAIAAALGDADALIESLEKLIAKKRLIKKGAMQELLTGKRRLPGFSGDWETKRLGEIADLYQPETISQEAFVSDGFPVYGANGIIGFYSRFNHAHPQITISCRGNCGTVNLTIPNSWITGNAMVVNLEGKGVVDQYFLFQLLSTLDYSLITTGSGQPQIVRGPLAALQIKIPIDLSEQQAVSEVMRSCDCDIAQNEARLAKARSIKQGMMQELLTGRIRLI